METNIFLLQVKSLLRKNLVSAHRSRELHLEIAIPLVVSVMLVFKVQLGPISTILPMIFGLIQCPTGRSIAIGITEEKSKRFKETQKVHPQFNRIRSWGSVKVRMLLDGFSPHIFDSWWWQ